VSECGAIDAKVQSSVHFCLKSVSDTSSSSSAPRVALHVALLASARHVQAVLAGRSLSDALAGTPAAVRPVAQALSFHAMRRLGLAMALWSELAARPAPNPLANALMLLALSLLDTAAAASDRQAADPAHAHPFRRSEPVYAVHTVVDQTVQAFAADKRLAGYRGLANACLRRFVRERTALLQKVADRPAARFNHPEWWIRRLQKAYPAQWADLLAAANLPAPMVLRVNRRRTTVGDLLRLFHEAGVQARALDDHAVVLETPRPVADLPGFSQGWWSVQDYSAQKAGRLLPVRDGSRVLDACAAPGGKTAHLLERADIQLLALDADAHRLARVRENLDRLGLGGEHARLHCADASDLAAWWDGTPFDAVLADVPCTGSGVVRRHPDIRWLRRESDIAKTVVLQRAIIDALWQTVAVGGHLLYVTCSIFPEEGELQAAQFARRHADARRLPAPGQILPHASDTDALGDGFFYALFVKAA
jgi:16S rRNA (cytosine967-C5)-methyltransferase